MRLYAIIGETASGKSDLALRIAEYFSSHHQAVSIFSLDSLAIYRFIDIASAKPSKDDLVRFKHYGVDVLLPNEACNIGVIMKIFEECLEACEESDSIVLFVGGSSFYLKSLIEGLSKPPPPLEAKQQAELTTWLANPKEAFAFLTHLDPSYMAHIQEGDSYRLQKAMEIYLATSLTPSEYFKQYPKITPLKKPIEIFNLTIHTHTLEQNIKKRTQKMLDMGLVDEVKALINQYGTDIQPSKSIGIKETIQYLTQGFSIQELGEQITLHTRQFAKRQRTFNRTQFRSIHALTKEEIYQRICHT